MSIYMYITYSVLRAYIYTYIYTRTYPHTSTYIHVSTHTRRFYIHTYIYEHSQTRISWFCDKARVFSLYSVPARWQAPLRAISYDANTNESLRWKFIREKASPFPFLWCSHRYMQQTYIRTYTQWVTWL